MSNPRRRRLGVILALGAAATTAFAGSAGAGQVFRETVHDERMFVIEDFCDQPGMTVDVASTLDLRVHAVAHRRDRLAYFLQHGVRTQVLTNPDTGASVTSSERVTEKDLRVTDNGDGTLTILILATGIATVYGEDGKAIARDPGQVRLMLLVDHGGTPEDPDDDEVLADLGQVKGSTGRSDDFCDAVVPALG